MRSLRQFFSYLNDISFQYVVLRNFDNLPDSVEMGDHSDLDLLVYDYDHFKEVISELRAEFPFPRVRHRLDVGDQYIFMDIRHLGDGYYPADFEKAILDTRELDERGFYKPNPLHHRLALAYHVVHHKGGFAFKDDYKKWLGNVTTKELLEALKDSNIGWIAPTDKSVGTYNAYWKGATAVVSKTEDWVVKKQTGFMAYGLIENEKRILKEFNSEHFPKLLGGNDTEVIIEDCGVPLTVDNLPRNWKEQLIAIITILKSHGITHRDIKPDNLMVKDGAIKLIDFGWAIYDHETDTPPSCLGYPYRPSDRFDDTYSMRKIMKEFNFKLEQKLEALECESLA